MTEFLSTQYAAAWPANNDGAISWAVRTGFRNQLFNQIASDARDETQTAPTSHSSARACGLSGQTNLHPSTLLIPFIPFRRNIEIPWLARQWIELLFLPWSVQSSCLAVARLFSRMGRIDAGFLSQSLGSKVLSSTFSKRPTFPPSQKKPYDKGGLFCRLQNARLCDNPRTQYSAISTNGSWWWVSGFPQTHQEQTKDKDQRGRGSTSGGLRCRASFPGAF